MQLKIVSLNVWNGGRLFPAMRDFLLAQQADIYFLQEVYNGQGEGIAERFRTASVLQQVFPKHQAFFAPVYIDTRAVEGEIEEGNLILSRWPIRERENIFIDVPLGKFDQDRTTDFSHFPSPLQRAVIEVEGKSVTLMNIHGPVNLDGTADTPRRLHLRDHILERVTEYSIVGGDFNMQPATQTIAGIETKLRAALPHDRGTSFNVARKDLERFPGYATAVVDMLFVSEAMRVVKAEMPQVDVSDHFPMVVEVEG